MSARSRCISATFVILLFCQHLCPQVLFCRKPGINGKDENASRAHQFLPPKTSDMSKAVIYVENTPDGFYFHSNFVTSGFDNPTKALIKTKADFRTIFVNMIFGSEFSGEQKETASLAYKKEARILLDSTMFTDGGYPLIDVGEASKISIVDGSTGKILVGPVESLNRTSPPPVLMSRVVGCCLFGIPPHLSSRYAKVLAERPLQKSNVRFLSLVRDTGTEIAIEHTANLRAARLGDRSTPIMDLAQVEKTFQVASGSTVVLMSHVEGESFVIRDAAHKVVSSMPVEAVRSLASKYNIELIDLGCETAQQLRAAKLGIGVTTKFNTVDAVRALDRALTKSSNYSEFFQALTSENLRVVIDEGFTQHWPLCADVYAKAGSRNTWIKLARLFVNFRSPGPDVSSFHQDRKFRPEPDRFQEYFDKVDNLQGFFNKRDEK
jgi:hypothetical protein